MGKFTEEVRGMEIDRKVQTIMLVLAILVVFLGCTFTNSKDSTTNVEIVHANEDEDTNISITLGKYDVLVGPVDTNFLIVEEVENDFMSENVLSETSDDEDIPDEELPKEAEPAISIRYNEYFTGNTDIGKGMSGVTAEMLDEATEYFQQMQDFDNPFKGNGWIFIEAQEQSGLDALWIYSLAVFESGWGTSKIARERSNYFGIGAWDIDMERSKYMGNDLYSGIVNGAIWISEHYYTQGQNTMTLMNSVPAHSYAPGNKVWVPKVVDFVNTFYENWREI